MSLPRLLDVFVLAGTLAIAACTGSGATPVPSAAPSAVASAAASAAPSAAAPSPAAAGPTVTVALATTSAGMVLTGPNGRTLYIHAGDGMNMSTCTGACATAWPPLTVSSGQSTMAGAGVTGQLASFTRSDGTAQVTYNGMPLYYWQGDTKPGDATGQGVNGFTVAFATAAAPGSPAAASATPNGYGY